VLKLFNFACSFCLHSFEELVDESSSPRCPSCGSTATERTPGIASPSRVIRTTSRTSKRFKAGYVHHYNRPAEKRSIQVPRLVGKP
jgi:DNA-directed RNA polymerase subunit RPC12/RpoP